MPTHFLDISGKIKDLEAVLSEQKDELREALDANDKNKADRMKQLIRETENKIEGMKNSPYYNG